MKWQIGDVRITQFVEIDTLGGKAYILPQATTAALSEIPWLPPRFADGAGRIRMTIHSFLVETPQRRIIVDTGIGNNKENRTQPIWNGRQGRFLEDLAAAGCPPDTIDTVICTHLHVDHVGFNTTLSEGRWVPTFVNARYLMGRVEFGYWKDVRNPAVAPVFDDSVRPVADAGLVDLIDPGDDVGAEFTILSTPGHSPGHLSVLVQSRGEAAVLIGDVAHHPCQLVHLDWGSTVDSDPQQAIRTRHELFSRLAGTPTRVLGGHFVGGTVVRDGDAFRVTE